MRDTKIPHRSLRKIMKKTQILKGALLACCLIGMLMLPVAAAPAGQAMNKSVLDPRLKNDLWNAQEQHRLTIFDANVAHANSVIGILGTYSIDTTQLQATLTQISGERPALKSAFAGQDRTALKTVNQQLETLWKQFRQEAATAVKEHYKQARQTGSTSSGITGTSVSGNTGVPAI